MSIRNRIEVIEAAILQATGDDVEARRQMFLGQLPELTDAELDRLEAITERVIEIGGDDGFMLAPADCTHLRDFIAHVDADEAAYLAEYGRHDHV